MLSASKMRASLATSGLDPASVDDLVKGAIARGEAQDDSVTPETMEKVIAALRETGSGLSGMSETLQNPAELVKADLALAEDEAHGWQQAATIIADGADKIAKAQSDAFRDLVLGFQASVTGIETLAKAVSDLRTDVMGLRSVLDKGASTVVPPRSVRSSLSVVPHPGDVIAKSGDGGISRETLEAKVRALMKSADPNERQSALEAAGLLTNGADLLEVAAVVGMK